MRAEFTLVPLAAMAIVSPVHAAVFMNIEQAQQVMFPGAAFTADFRMLTNEQAAAIRKTSGVNVRSRNLKVWRVSTGDWFIADDVVGKHEYIPFALALNADGSVKSIEILEYREAYGGEIRGAAWRAQFAGKRHGAQLTLAKDIKNISGATLSSRHLTDGIKRLLATYDLVLAPD